MTSGSSASGSRVASRLGFSDRIFIGPQARRLLAQVEAGLDLVEDGLARDLRVTDSIANSASRYLYEAGGKRVRPMLTLLAAQLGKGNTEGVIEAAKALEMTHLGSLYHDDVMDDSDRRRGVPSAHAVWGNNVAILTGDLLFARASQIMAQRGDRAIRLQADTFERLVLGQMHETVGAQPGDDPIEFYLQVLRDKTGSLIAASAQAGIIFSEAPDEFEAALGTYGEKVGVAFQLMDDVIDLSANAAETGKVPGTDLRAGVPTMPYLLLSLRGDDAAKALRSRIDEGADRIAGGEDPSVLDAEVEALRKDPATDATRTLAHEWAAAAVAALDIVPAGSVRDALTKFAGVVADRRS